jgi:YHS domain-containing protein
MRAITVVRFPNEVQFPLCKMEVSNNLSFLVYLLEIQGIFLDLVSYFFSKIRVYPLFEKKNAKITRKKSELQEIN